jgi:hypothetical protein
MASGMAFSLAAASYLQPQVTVYAIRFDNTSVSVTAERHVAVFVLLQGALWSAVARPGVPVCVLVLPVVAGRESQIPVLIEDSWMHQQARRGFAGGCACLFLPGRMLDSGALQPPP